MVVSTRFRGHSASQYALRVGILAASLGLGYLLGASDTGVLLVVGLAVLVPVLMKPAWGLYAAYGVLILVPYGAYRFDLPILHSPIQIIVLLTLGAAITRFLLRRHRLAPSRIYLPLVLSVFALGVFAIAGHGEVAPERFLYFVEALWPLAVVLLVVETPRDARNVVLALTLSCVALSLLWLPGLLQSSSQGVSARAASQGIQVDPTLGVALLGYSGGISYFVFLTMAFLAPVPLAVAAGSSRWRLPALVVFGALCAAILLGTFAAGVVALAVSTTAVVTLTLASRAGNEGTRRRAIGVPTVLFGFVGAVLIVVVLPPARTTLERILHPSLDLSASGRMVAFIDGVHAFLSRPLLGYGAFDRSVTTSTGWTLGGHNSFVVMGYEFGLAFLVPFAWLLWAVGRELVELRRRASTPVEKAVAMGMFAGYISALATAFIDPVFGKIYPDVPIWTFAGLAILWNSWKRVAPDSPLLE